VAITIPGVIHSDSELVRFDFLEWTDSNHVRHIKFVAMRDDKDPRKVVRIQPRVPNN
jgi:ATP-dependent DNA ligase